MKNSNKKGFTIVELVIVIDVIAILAAVLIPTFSSLVKKANLSADKQAVREMNIALATDEAKNGKPANLTKAREVLIAAGYAADYLKPITSNHAFFWSQRLNIIGLIDLENAGNNSSYTLVYPTDNADAKSDFGEYFANWFNLSNYDEAIATKVTKAIEDAKSSNNVISITATEASEDVSAGALTFQEVVAYCSQSGAKLDDCTINLPATTDTTKIEIDAKAYGRINELNGKIAGADSGTTIVIKNLDAVHDVKGNGEGYLLADYVEPKENIHKQKVGTAFINYLGEGGIVENLTIEYAQSANPSDPGNKYTYYGGIVGFLNGGTIKNCKVTGTIQQCNRVGGIVGFAIGGTIEGCTVENLTINLWKSADDTNGYYTYAGGIVAFAGKEFESETTLTIENCKVNNFTVGFGGYYGEEGKNTKGKVQAVGSIVGGAEASSKAAYKVIIKNCTVSNFDDNDAKVKGTDKFIGSTGGSFITYENDGNIYGNNGKELRGTFTEADGTTTYVFNKTETN